MIRQRVKSFNVRPDAQKDFNAHVQTSMQDMVWTGTCRSWCKSRIPNVSSIVVVSVLAHTLQSREEAARK